MRVLYLACHGKHDADDEGAVSHALAQLGHDVIPIHERDAGRGLHEQDRADFLLCHHFHDVGMLRRFHIPKVFWTFDRIDCPDDSTLAERSARRRAWIGDLTSACDLGFMTDGDWVAQDQTGKLSWLTQGADERIVGRGSERPDLPRVPILFTGASRGGGVKRESFVAEMAERYGPQFVHVAKGTYREGLRDLIAISDVVVAPDYPISHRYWSNRIYNALGFGALLFHPYCSELAKELGSAAVEWYASRGQLHRLLRWALRLSPEARRRGGELGLRAIRSGHLYRHRCERLIATVRERLNL